MAKHIEDYGSGVPCQPCVVTRIFGIRKEAYKEIARKKGDTMTNVLRNEIAQIVTQYPDTFPISSEMSVSEIKIEKLGHCKDKLQRICAFLNVDTSDFLKIKLYDKLLLNEVP